MKLVTLNLGWMAGGGWGVAGGDCQLGRLLWCKRLLLVMIFRVCDSQNYYCNDLFQSWCFLNVVIFTGNTIVIVRLLLVMFVRVGESNFSDLHL